MKYTVQKLDGRFSYISWFKYYIGFSQRMSNHQGPLCFTQAQKWFFDTYGWSAEVRQYSDIHRWLTSSVPMMRVAGGFVGQKPTNIPDECNPHWSWTNGYDDLRIYVASEKELAFFQLANPLTAA